MNFPPAFVTSVILLLKLKLKHIAFDCLALNLLLLGSVKKLKESRFIFASFLAALNGTSNVGHAWRVGRH